jgi:hypothetical protein
MAIPKRTFGHFDVTHVTDIANWVRQNAATVPGFGEEPGAWL